MPRRGCEYAITVEGQLDRLRFAVEPVDSLIKLLDQGVADIFAISHSAQHLAVITHAVNGAKRGIQCLARGAGGESQELLRISFVTDRVDHTGYQAFAVTRLIEGPVAVPRLCHVTTNAAHPGPLSAVAEQGQAGNFKPRGRTVG
jgi:hypothetical protein